MKLLCTVLLVLWASTSYAVDCNDTEQTKILCDDIDTAIQCLKGNRSCDNIRSLAGTLPAALYYLGKVEGRVAMLASEGRIDGRVRSKVQSLIRAMHNPAWVGRSVDLNWIAAINEANDIADDAGDRLRNLLR